MAKSAKKTLKKCSNSKKMAPCKSVMKRNFGYLAITTGIIGVIALTVIATPLIQGDKSDNYNVLGASTSSTLAAPTNLRVVNNTILTWNSVPGASGYYVYILSNGNYDQIASTTSTSKGIISPTVENNSTITNFFKVRAFKKIYSGSSLSIQTSVFSNSANITWKNTSGNISAL